MTTVVTGTSATTNEIVLNGSTSGTATLQAPAVAGTTTITLPSSTGTLAITADAYTDADALSLFNAAGSAPVYACRAWVKFNGTGTVAINGSGNVSSITDNATGDYTINFSTSLEDGDFATTVSAKQANSNSSQLTDCQTYSPTTSGVSFIAVNSGSTKVDAAIANVIVIR